MDHILENFLNHGVNIYRNPSANEISNIWKSILLIHLILDIIETIFPRKEKTPDRHLRKDEGIVEKAGEKAATDKKPDKNPGAAWVYLLLAGLLEIVWATALKTDMLGGPLILALILSFDLLIKAVRRLGVGTAYAVFTGIGTAGLVLVDIIFQGDLGLSEVVFHLAARPFHHRVEMDIRQTGRFSPMSWICLVLAGLTEVTGVVGLKKVSEKGSWFTYLLMIGGFLVSLTLLRVSLEEIPLSIAYAVWTGIGTMGAAMVGILFFKESKSPGRILCILGIIACVIGLRWIA